MTARAALRAVEHERLPAEDFGELGRGSRRHRALGTLRRFRAIALSPPTLGLAILLRVAPSSPRQPVCRTVCFPDDLLDELADVVAHHLGDREGVLEDVPDQVRDGHPELVRHLANVFGQSIGDARVQNPLLSVPTMLAGAATLLPKPLALAATLFTTPLSLFLDAGILR
jgi:hypothetical protein